MTNVRHNLSQNDFYDICSYLSKTIKLSANRKFDRVTEWWRPKSGTILSLLLFHLAFNDVAFGVGWKLLLFSLVTLTGFGLIGYMLNDWADIPHDRKVGKTNLVDGIPPVWRMLILLGLLVITLFPWLVFFRMDVWSFVLIISQFVLQLAYPVPPVRLKNHPRVAIVVDSLYAFVIPTLLAWHTFDLTSGSEGKGTQFHFLVLGVWMFALGIRHMLNHHVADRHNDAATGTPNLANRIQPIKLRKAIQWCLFPVEIFASILFFALLLRDGGYLPLVPIICIAILGAGHIRDVYPFVSVSFSKTTLDRLVSFYLGLISSAALIAFEWRYIVVAIIFILLFSDVLFHPIFGIAVKRIRRFLVGLVKFPFNVGSLAANWSIYYFRRWVLNWNEERNWGEHYSKHLSDLELAARKKRGVLAVFNQNHNKYTETFVTGHLQRLPYHVVPFHGWPSPIHVGEMENLISDELFLQKSHKSAAQLLDVDLTQRENEVISKRLIEENVEVVLAEFGTMGARLVDVCGATGIPLIVTFYGYDAWHRKILDENRQAYSKMFDMAVCVIGVSKDICIQLEQLGCAKDKTVYLPCYVDLNRFAFIERDFTEPNFLAVGRFCHTKAPHLSIMAFNEVVKKTPAAKLTMIGADDGSGVLEHCITLIRALKLDKNVEIIGSQPTERVFQEMQKASIFVQHSVTAPETGDKEGTPVAIMEAMATGLPIISTRHAGIAEMIEDGRTGILVEEFDYLRMAEEMTGLIQDVERMRRMGQQAAAAIRSNKLVAEHIEQLTEIIDKISSRK
jgi:colanic acid/amylovoran biosynthesis glycosyltransferase